MVFQKLCRDLPRWSIFSLVAMFTALACPAQAKPPRPLSDDAADDGDKNEDDDKVYRSDPESTADAADRNREDRYEDEDEDDIRERRRFATSSLLPDTLPPPSEPDIYYAYGVLCGSRCLAPPVLSHLAAPFLASWASVGFIDSSEHFSTETKLATGLLLLVADMAGIIAVGILLSPLGLIPAIAFAVAGGLGLAIGAVIYGVIVGAVVIPVWLLTPILASQYLVRNKRRDLPYYHRYPEPSARDNGARPRPLAVAQSIAY